MMTRELTVRVARTAEIGLLEWSALVALCTEAYEEPFAPYLAAIGPGVHLLGYESERLVSHLMWVEREMRVTGAGALRSAYIEAVATLPEAQGNGHATALLRRAATMLDAFDLALLSPSEEAFYARLGWATWRGPLSVCGRDGTITPTPDEELMWLRLPRTPATVDAHAAIETDWRPGEAW